MAKKKRPPAPGKSIAKGQFAKDPVTGLPVLGGVFGDHSSGSITGFIAQVDPRYYPEYYSNRELLPSKTMQFSSQGYEVDVFLVQLDRNRTYNISVGDLKTGNPWIPLIGIGFAGTELSTQPKITNSATGPRKYLEVANYRGPFINRQPLIWRLDNTRPVDTNISENLVDTWGSAYRGHTDYEQIKPTRPVVTLLDGFVSSVSTSLRPPFTGIYGIEIGSGSGDSYVTMSGGYNLSVVTS